MKRNGEGADNLFFRMIMKVLSEIMHELNENGNRQSFEDLEQERSWQIKHQL